MADWGRLFVLAGVQACADQALAAVSETDFLGELPVVLSASRMSQPVNDAPAAVTIIDRDMIQASGFRDIPDLLRLVPGFSVAYTRDNTWAVGYHGLADAYSRRFQVLVDGRSIYSPHFGAVHGGDLPVAIEDIERIEVVRGPNAAVYGSNAFLAVINVVTQSAAQAQGGLASHSGRHFAQSGTPALAGNRLCRAIQAMGAGRERQAVLRHAGALHRHAKGPDGAVQRTFQQMFPGGQRQQHRLARLGGRLHWRPLPRLEAHRFKWQGRNAELALVAQSIGNRYPEFRLENGVGAKACASFSLDW